MTMKNTIVDLNNYLFECIENLNDNELDSEALEKEIKRSDAVQRIAKTIIENGALALKAQEMLYEQGHTTKIEMPLLGITDS